MVILGTLLTACASMPQKKLEAITTIGKTPEMKVAFKKDYGQRKGTITEFIPPDENIQNWQHLATIQFIESESRTPLEFM